MDIFNEIMRIDSKINFLTLEKNQLESFMSEARLAVGGNCNELILDETSAEIVDIYKKMRRLLLQEIKLKKQLWLLVESLPKKEMIDVISYSAIKGLNVSEIAEKMEYSTRQVQRLLNEARRILDEKYAATEGVNDTHGSGDIKAQMTEKSDPLNYKNTALRVGEDD